MVQHITDYRSVLSDTGTTAIFFTYFGVGMVLFFISLYVARNNRDTLGATVTPFLALAISYENLAIALSVLLDYSKIRGVLAVRGMVQAFEVPLAILALWELNYGVRKRRSANFCCLRFDLGHRSRSSFLSHVMRYSMWLMALAILIFELVLNANYSASPAEAPISSRFTFKGIPFDIYQKPDTFSKNGARPFDWQDAADFFPPCILVVVALYTGLSLWRFGTFISTDIWTTSLNPWISVVIATLAYFFIWLFTPRFWMFPYIMNVAYLLLLTGLVITVGLVEANFRTLEAWEKTLENTNENTLANEVRKETEAQLRDHVPLTEGLVSVKNGAQKTNDTNTSSDAYPLHIKVNNDFTGIQLTSPRTIESLQKLEPYPPRDPEQFVSSESSHSRSNPHTAAASASASAGSIVSYENPDYRPGRSASPRYEGSPNATSATTISAATSGAGGNNGSAGYHPSSRYAPLHEPASAAVPAPVPSKAFASPTAQPMLRSQYARTDVEEIQTSPTFADPSRVSEYSVNGERSHSPSGPQLQSRSALVQGRDPQGYPRQQPKESYPSIRNDVYPYHSLSYYANQKRPVPSGSSEGRSGPSGASSSMGGADRAHRNYGGRGSVHNVPPYGHNNHMSPNSYIDEAIQPPGNLPPY